jgi:hypothetical protein
MEGKYFTHRQTEDVGAADSAWAAMVMAREKDELNFVKGTRATTGILDGRISVTPDGHRIVADGTIYSQTTMGDRSVTMMTTVWGPTTALVDSVTGTVTLQNPQ